ncbi:hypothetical protein [Lactococcus garvieae]|uniref:hypothetical protein n=1 Tax=Lactococcus garvieae TaxID=1363 RepID=UPI00254B11C1|nr:hypothetical protein [Lactococcus garvieae]
MSLKIPDFSKYQIYREKVGEGIANPSALFNNFLSNTFLNIPLEFLRVLVGVATVLSQLLDVSSALGGVQKSLMNTSQSIFLSLIGGSNGTITRGSVAGVLITLTMLYLAYHWFSGKGKFWSSLVHLIAIISTMFFFFGSFTYTNSQGQTKTDMGGQIAFDTVRNLSKTAQDNITKSLTGYTTPDESSDFFESFVLKPAANLANLGNVDGKLADGKNYFDYDAANGKKKGYNHKKGQAYVDDVAKHNSNGYLQNTGGHFGEEFMGICIEVMNLFMYIIPVLLIKVLISIYSLILCLLIMLWPLSAVLSFIPIFRNAFFHVIKISLGVLIAPTLLTIFMSFIFYLITRIDFAVLSSATGTSVTDLVASMSLISGPVLMAVLTAIFILKLSFMIFIWKNKGKVISFVTGGSSAGQQLMQHADTLSNHISQGVQNIRNKAVGAAEVGVGAATGNPALAVDGAQMLAPKTETQSSSSVQSQPDIKEQTQNTMQTPESFEKDDMNPLKEESLSNEAPDGMEQASEFYPNKESISPDLEDKEYETLPKEHESLSDLSETVETPSSQEETSPTLVEEVPISDDEIEDNQEEFLSSNDMSNQSKNIENIPYSEPEQTQPITMDEPFENSKEIAKNWEEASGILAEMRG